MIGGWRSSRRIGPPSFIEQLRENARWPAIIVIGSAVMATTTVLIKFDDLWNQVAAWPIMFLVISIVLAIKVLWIRGWNWFETFVTTGLIALMFFSASKLNLSIYIAILGHEPAMIIPATP